MAGDGCIIGIVFLMWGLGFAIWVAQSLADWATKNQDEDQ